MGLTGRLHPCCSGFSHRIGQHLAFPLHGIRKRRWRIFYSLPFCHDYRRHSFHDHEFSLGHKLRGAAPRAFSKLGTKFEWLGWFQVSIAAIIAVYYVAIIGWAISYLGMAFTQSWGSDTNAFFFSEYLKLGENSPSQLGSLQFHIAIPMTIAWAITFAAIFTGVKGGIERASKIMMPLLFLMVLGFISRVVFLPGAMDGLNYLFQPDFSKILDAKVWSAAYGQIFFTLSVGFAIMIAYSSYLPKKSDINNNAFMTVLINCGFSIMRV